MESRDARSNSVPVRIRAPECFHSRDPPQPIADPGHARVTGTTELSGARLPRAPLVAQPARPSRPRAGPLSAFAAGRYVITSPLTMLRSTASLVHGSAACDT